jgi:hypothetical protein
MRKVLIGIAGAVVALLVVAQIVLPRVAAHRVEDRLERDGGSAHAEVSAFPAVTLLGGRGRKLDVTGSDLTYDLSQRGQKPFDRLDGFARVRVDLRSLDAGPVRLRHFLLTRSGRGEPYALSMRGTTTPRDLAAELGTATGGTLGGLIGGLASGALPGDAGENVPLSLDASVTSRGGSPDVDNADATVAGLPAGPLTELVLRSVLDRL